jgi:phosphoglycerate dehydrogenase-like enzyme
MMRRLLVTIEEQATALMDFDRLRAAGLEPIRRPDLGAKGTVEQLTEALQGVWGVIASSESYSRPVFEGAPDLRLIARPGAGYDSVDIAAATDHGVLVFRTPGVNRHAVADLSVALMLSCLRRLEYQDRGVREGAWRPKGLPRELHGRIVGIAGLGPVGQTVAMRLSGFECRVLATEPFPDLEFCRKWSIELTTLEEMLPQVDVLTLHVPLTDQTRHLLNSRTFSMLRGAVLVNTSRGAVVDEIALLEAMADGNVVAAGLDVFEHEPLPVDHPLTRVPNVILGGHVGSLTADAVKAMMDGAVDGTVAYAGGQLPLATLNPEVSSAPRPGLSPRTPAGGRP